MYRVGSFVVPVAARDEFLQSVAQALTMLAEQDGFVSDVVLEAPTGEADRVNILTVVEWESADVLERVSAAVAKSYHERGYDPNARLRELGIEKREAVYTPIQH
jgi:heme-degrading monooxygenase HmoA